MNPIIIQHISLIFVAAFVYLIRKEVTSNHKKESLTRVVWIGYVLPFVMLAGAFACACGPKMFMSHKDAATADAAMVRAAIENDPSMLVDAFKKGQEKLKAKQEEAKGPALQKFLKEKSSETAIAYLGDKNATKVMYEFFDYNCHYCTKAMAEVNTILAQHKDVKVVLQMLPILSPISEIEARASLAAFMQNPTQAQKMHEKLLGGTFINDIKPKLEKAKSQDDMTKIVMDQLSVVAKSFGINADQMKKDMESKTVSDAMTESKADAEALGIQGTPGFVINGQFFGGYIDAAQMNSALTK